MWLILEWITSGDALDAVLSLLDVLDAFSTLRDGLGLFDRDAAKESAPLALIAPRPWWPKPRTPNKMSVEHRG